MTKRTVIEADLKTAQSELDALRADLPQFHALLTDNEQDAQRLKSERASLDAQAQAKGRVEVAREMLEQHQSDIQAAQAEVARLEVVLEREVKLQMLEQYATEHARHKNAFDDRLATANKALEGNVQKILTVHGDFMATHEAFAALLGSDESLRDDLTARGQHVRLASINFESYPWPQPHGVVVGQIIYNMVVERAQAAERARQAAQRAPRHKPTPPKLAGLAVDPRDADAVVKRLGDLVQGVVSRQNANIGLPNDIMFNVSPDDVERAERLLHGISFARATG